MADSSGLTQLVPVVMAGVAVLGVVAQGLVSAFRAGRHSQRLEHAESDITDLQGKVEGIHSVETLMAGLSAEMKGLGAMVGQMSITLTERIRDLERDIQGLAVNGSRRRDDRRGDAD